MKRIKLFKENKSSRIIKILSILILSFIYYKKKTYIKSNKLVIQVDISKSNRLKGGPKILRIGMSKVLPYETAYCKFIPANGIYPNDIKYIDYFFITSPSMNEKIYDKWIKINRVTF